MIHPEQQGGRWEEEARFFDREAEEARRRLAPLGEETLRRYSTLRRPHWNKEYRFRLLGDLRDRTVLDIGCGDGENSVLLARLGARVTGIDLSPGAVALSEERARLDGVSDRTRFVCSPIEKASFARGSFDVIWVEAVLHHLIPVLGDTLRRLASWRKPGGVVIINEPVNLNPVLRRLRLRLPIAVPGTPDERPLETAEIDAIHRALPGTKMRHFHLFGRLTRFFLHGMELESASPPLRFAATALAFADRALLSVPFTRSLAGMCVFYQEDGRPLRPQAQKVMEPTDTV